VAGLGVHGGDDPVRRHPLGDAPRALLLTGLDVLAGDERQQAHGVGLGLGELDAVHGGDDGPGVVHQSRHQGGLGLGVVPGAHRLAGGVVVMGRHRERCGFGDEAADPADGRDELGHGVLGGHGIVEQGGVQGSAPAPGQHAGGFDDLGHRLFDALGAGASVQAGAPVGEDGEVDPGMIQRQAGGHLPSDVAAQGIGGLAVGVAFELLEHHGRGDDLGRHRGSARSRWEQVGEGLVGKQLRPVIGQEGMHRAVRHQLATECASVEQLGIGIALALHRFSMKKPLPNREHLAG
jgi:hypothetical protein